MDDEIQSLMRRDTWEIVSRKSVAGHNVLPGTWSSKCKRKPDWTIRKSKARYCVRGDIVFSSGTMGHSEFDVDFAVYSSFEESKFLLQKFLCSGIYSKWGVILHWTSQGFQE